MNAQQINHHHQKPRFDDEGECHSPAPVSPT